MAGETSTKRARAAKRPALSKRGARRTSDASIDLPAFAKSFPDDAELRELCRVFEAGDYARVRVEAAELAERRDKPDEVRAAASELRARIEPPRLAVRLLGLAAVLLTALASYHLSHDDGARQPRLAPAGQKAPAQSVRAPQGSPRGSGDAPPSGAPAVGHTQ